MKELFNSCFKRLVLPCMMAALVLLAAGVARADSIYTVTLTQVGSNVVATGSGSINLADLTLYATGDFFAALVDPTQGTMLTGPTPSSSVGVYSGITGPASFGSGAFTTDASSGSGDFVGIFGSDTFVGVPVLIVPNPYASGTALSDSSAYDSQTFASLGVTPGTYTWTWGSGANTGSFVLKIGVPTVVPEPGTESLMVIGVGLLGLIVTMRKLEAVSKPSARRS